MSDFVRNMALLRGRVRANADLAKINWFQVGGKAEFLFKPEDADDLAYFLSSKPENLPVTTLGVGSNLLVRDGGIEGVVIRLGRGFTECTVENDRLVVGAGALNANATAFACENGIGGLEFLSGVPGTIGGALAMNAGAYGTETKDVLVEAHAIDGNGHYHVLVPEKLGYDYRHCSLPEDWIFTKAVLQGKKEDVSVITARMKKIARLRGATQPIRSRTGGSTFKNPRGMKAWQLIDAAGCRGLKIGGAQMSEKHCNFMINTGKATAQDLETLGEEVIERVLVKCGIKLEWEIRRVGRSMSVEAKGEMAVA